MARIDDGFRTWIEFTETPVGGSLIWEKRVKPPGMSGGGPNDTTTMRNDAWRTKNPKSLLDLTEMSATVSYDPEVFTSMLAALLLNQVVVVLWPDGAQLTFYGWLDSFEPNEIVEGSQPEAEIKVVPSNQDENGDEVAPTLTPGTS